MKFVEPLRHTLTKQKRLAPLFSQQGVRAVHVLLKLLRIHGVSNNGTQQDEDMTNVHAPLEPVT